MNIICSCYENKKCYFALIAIKQNMSNYIILLYHLFNILWSKNKYDTRCWAYLYLQNPNGNAIYLPYSSSSQAKSFFFGIFAHRLCGAEWNATLACLAKLVFINTTIMKIWRHWDNSKFVLTKVCIDKLILGKLYAFSSHQKVTNTCISSKFNSSNLFVN